MKKRTQNKIIAGVGTVWFMSLITTNAQPKLWQVAMIGIAFYEIAQIAIRTAQKRAYRKRESRYITVMRENGKRLEEARINWPMQEVL